MVRPGIGGWQKQVVPNLCRVFSMGANFPTREPFGGAWGVLRVPWKVLGASWEPRGASWEPLGKLFEVSERPLERSWAPLGNFWEKVPKKRPQNEFGGVSFKPILDPKIMKKS